MTSAAAVADMRIEDVTLGDLAARFGTPFFVYSEAALVRAHRDATAALPPGARVVFSIKANPNPHIASVFRRLGCGAEIASAGELRIAKRAGFTPDQILFAGPGKTDRELSLAAELGLCSINVESIGEARRLAAIAARARTTCRVCLRVNPAEASDSARMHMGGAALAFGVDEEVAADVLREIEALDGLDLVGIHLYVGTQVLDEHAAADTLRKGFELGRLFERTLGRPPALVDVGLGLGRALFEDEQELDIPALAQAIATVGPLPWRSAALDIELGRFLVANAGTYVCSVVDIKHSRGTRFVVLDGGMQHHAAAAGGFGNVFRRQFPIECGSSASPVEPTSLVGPCCTPLDQFARSVDTGAVDVGDLVAIRSSGAYALSASPIMFLAHESPAEILVSGATARVIRRSAPTDDLFVPD